MIIGTFNGWNIIQVPTTPVSRQLDFTIHDSVGSTQSSFTMQSQVQAWPGADWWELNFSLPAMKAPQADAWIAFLMELRGKLNVFSVGDASKTAPRGTALGSPVVDGSSVAYNMATSTVLHTKGWQANKSNLLLPRDYFQIGYRLYSVLNPVNSDANGNATIDIWPSLREQPLDGQALTLTNTTGLFRLADNKREWSVRETKMYGISFKCVEAR